MASMVALRAEMREIVLRGFQHFRAIEIANEVAESLLLEARMIAAAAFADYDDKTAPSPLEIRLACEAIRASWSDEDHEKRLCRVPVGARREWTPAEIRSRVKCNRYVKQANARVRQRYSDRRRERLATRRMVAAVAC